MYHDKTRNYPDYEGWRLEADLWYDGGDDDIDPEEQEFQDAFDALADMPAHELARYFGVALEADAESMEV